MAPTDELTDELIQQAAQGNETALAELFDRYRPRLRQMVRLRLDRRLQGRVDPSDVLQEAYLDLAKKLPTYAQKPPMPFFLWLRLVAGERLLRFHRHHLGAAMRDAGREISIHRGAFPQASSVSLAAHLLGRMSSPSRAAARAEHRLLLEKALESLEPIDREVIALRHFEEMSNDETAAVLELSKAAASKRYVRAMVRLKAALSSTPGFREMSGEEQSE